MQDLLLTDKMHFAASIPCLLSSVSISFNRFLASLVPFLHENLDYNSIYSLTLESFCEFLNRNIKQYDVNLPIGFVGSVAFYFSDVLNEAAERCGIRIAKIMKDPMTGLIEYHNN